MKISCTFETPSKFTVGDVKILNCEGKFPKTLGKLKIEFPNSSDKYALKILDIQSFSDHRLVLKVSGYRPGDYTHSHFIITDGVQSYTVENLSWNISSVLNKTKEVQPYPPYGPWKPPFPQWSLWSLGFIFLILIGWMLFQIKKIFMQNKLKNRIMDRLKGKTPLEYFIHQMTPFMIQKDAWDRCFSRFSRIGSDFK